MDAETILTTDEIALDAARAVVAKLDAEPDARYAMRVTFVQILIGEAIDRAKAEILRLVKESLGGPNDDG